MGLFLLRYSLTKCRLSLIPKNLEYDKRRSKAVVFFSASSIEDARTLRRFGIKEILVSYHYLRKSLRSFEELLKEVYEQDGIFMTDSGAFSFMRQFHEGHPEYDKLTSEEFWLPYLEEYVAWLRKHKEYIFVAANLDLDKVVGEEIVRKWNKKYFEPLEAEGLQIVYVAHRTNGDLKFTNLEYYCKRYKYVGVNQRDKAYAHKVATIANKYGTRIHGFAWTAFELCKRYPFFSVDSTTWLGGTRYGTTYDYDGKNFRTLDYKKKERIRKQRKVKLLSVGVDYEGVIGKKEDRYAVNNMNLTGWLGFRKEYIKMANLKLKTKYVSRYERKHPKKD